MKRLGWSWRSGTDPAALQKSEQPVAELSGDDVLVENRAVALNPVDWKVLGAGTLGWQPGHVPGVDGAGVVVACGPKAQWPEGTRVLYHQDLRREGSFATHTIVAARALHRLADGLGFADAATIPCPGLTMAQALAKLPDAPGRDVLVTGGGAATGTFLTQLAVARGYRVWTTAGPVHRARLMGYGVAGVFDYHEADWRAALEQALAGRRLYAAFDTIGEQHARALAPLIGYNGHLICVQGRVNMPPMPAFSTVISLHEVALGAIYRHGAPEDWAQLQQMGAALIAQAASGLLQLPARTRFDFEALPAALAGLKDASLQGKLVAEL